MKIAFLGDLHGCVRHALGAVVMLQARRGTRLDAVVQVGDLGAYPTAERYDESTRRFARGHPAQGDFLSLLDPTPPFADEVRAALQRIPSVLFVSGNHEDHDWLAELHEAAGAEIVPVDPLGACRHIACGTVVDVAGQRTAFLGIIESPAEMDLEPGPYAELLGAAPGTVDILVTHDGPYGLPRRYGRTTSFALAQMVRPKTTKWEPEPVNPEQRVTAGSVGLLDTETGEFAYINDPWLAEVSGDRCDLAALVAAA